MTESKHGQELRTPLVIAHRGASGLRCEHTLAAYALAIELGADFIETDLVATCDGVLVARHENELSTTTDVAAHPEFRARESLKQIDGQAIRGWFTEDFTLPELKTLRTRERLPELRPNNDRAEPPSAIPTFDEILALASTQAARRGRAIGVYPETKHPSYFSALGLALEPRLLSSLERFGYGGPNPPVFIQSFEVSNLERLASLTSLPLVQLIEHAGQPYDLRVAGDPRSYADLIAPAGLASIARYARAIGVHKQLVLPRDAANGLCTPTGLIAAAHAAGLLVHAWTFRNENEFLPAELQRGARAAAGLRAAHGDSAAEYAAFFAQGVDGVFSDFPGDAVAARARFWHKPA